MCVSSVQHIRQTVLTRASSKNQVENVEEETEAAMAQEAGGPEVIDLTDPRHRDNPHHHIQGYQHRDYKHTAPLHIAEGETPGLTFIDLQFATNSYLKSYRTKPDLSTNLDFFFTREVNIILKKNAIGLY